MAAHRYWRIQIDSTKSTIQATTPYMLLAEVAMYEDGSSTNVLTGGTPTASGTYSGRGPAGACDGSVASTSNIWENSATSGWWQYDFGAGVTRSITSVAITSYSQWSEEMPCKFRLQWSDDGTTFTDLYTYDFNKYCWKVSQTIVFGKYQYRLHVTAVQNSSSQNYIALGSIDVTDTTGTVLAGYGFGTDLDDGNNTADYLRDASVTTGWQTKTGVLAAYVYVYPNTQLQSYTLGVQTSYLNAMLKSWTFEQSMDGGATWTQVDAQTNVPAWTTGQTRTYTVTQPAAGPNFSASKGTAVATGTAALTTQKRLAASAAALCTATAALSTQKTLAGAAAVIGAATAALTTGINLAVAAHVAPSATADLATSIVLAGSAACRSSSSSDLSTAIQFAGAAEITGAASAALSTKIALAGAGASLASASADLKTGTLLYGTGSVSASASGALSTAVALAGAGAARATAQADLHTAIPLGGTAAARAAVTGQLATVIALAAQGQAVSAAHATFADVLRPATLVLDDTQDTTQLTIGTAKITVPLLDAAAGVFNPVASPRAQAWVPAALDAAPAVYAPATTTPAVQIALALIDSSEQLTTPALAPISVALAAPTVDAPATLAAPTVSAGVQLDTAPTIVLDVDLGMPALALTAIALRAPAMDTAADLPASTLSVGARAVAAPALDVAPALQDPVWAARGGVLVAPLLDTSVSLTSISVSAGAKSIAAPLFDSGVELLGLVLGEAPEAVVAPLLLPIYEAFPPIFSPSGMVPISVAALSSSADFPAPTVRPVSNGVSVGVLNTDATVYQPSQKSIAKVAAPTLALTTDFFAPAISTIAPSTLRVPALDTAPAAFDPALTGLAAPAKVATLDLSSSMPVPRFASAAQSIAAPVIDSDATLGQAAFSGRGLVVRAPALDLGADLFVPATSSGAAPIIFVPLDDEDAIYVPGWRGALLLTGKPVSARTDRSTLVSQQPYDAARAAQDKSGTGAQVPPSSRDAVVPASTNNASVAASGSRVQTNNSTTISRRLR